MRKIYCDRCGKEIKHEADVFNARILDITKHCQFIMAENDICGKCARDIAEYAKGQPADEAEEKAEEKRKAGRPKKEDKAIDLGKIKALRDAGWSFYDIAKEMNLSNEQTLDAFIELWRRG